MGRSQCLGPKAVREEEFSCPREARLFTPIELADKAKHHIPHEASHPFRRNHDSHIITKLSRGLSLTKQAARCEDNGRTM